MPTAYNDAELILSIKGFVLVTTGLIPIEHDDGNYFRLTLGTFDAIVIGFYRHKNAHRTIEEIRNLAYVSILENLSILLRDRTQFIPWLNAQPSILN